MRQRLRQLKGLMTPLTRFLIKRFGALDNATPQRVRQASVEQIEAWSDCVLEAESLEEVFSN